MGDAYTPPKDPKLVRDMVPPRMFSMGIVLFFASPTYRFISLSISWMVFCSTVRITGSRSPASVFTAKPMLISL
jgi:hypothetical protein